MPYLISNVRIHLFCPIKLELGFDVYENQRAITSFLGPQQFFLYMEDLINFVPDGGYIFHWILLIDWATQPSDSTRVYYISWPDGWRRGRVEELISSRVTVGGLRKHRKYHCPRGSALSSLELIQPPTQRLFLLDDHSNITVAETGALTVSDDKQIGLPTQAV